MPCRTPGYKNAFAQLYISYSLVSRLPSIAAEKAGKPGNEPIITLQLGV